MNFANQSQFTVEAIAVDSMETKITNQGVRIAFGESQDSTGRDIRWRTVIMLTPATFGSMADAWYKLLENLLEQGVVTRPKSTEHEQH